MNPPPTGNDDGNEYRHHPSLYELGLKLERLETLLNERMNRIDRLVDDHRTDFSEIETRLSKFEQKIEAGYITKTEFDPIKKLVYGAVGFILIAVLSSFMFLVVRTSSISPSAVGAAAAPVIMQQLPTLPRAP